MMLPCLGLVRGTQTTICRSGSASWSSRILSCSPWPPIVSFATTRTRPISPASSRGLRHRGRAGVGGGRAVAEHAVHRAWDAVLVGPADDGRHRVEVED